MTPYYSEDGIEIWHGDCRELTKWLLLGDVMVTDPPYGIDFCSGWTGAAIANDGDTAARDAVLDLWGGRPALVFGVAGEGALPGSTTAPLIWHRPGSGMGDLSLPWKPDYEHIHVLGRGFTAKYRGSSVLVRPWDVFRGDALHPHQKPLPLMRDLITKCPPGTIVDPFCGSGTTLRAAKDCGRRAIGVEVEERFCEIAARRLAQGVLDFGAVS
jgi:site-specific DNA-methyltransferase (adenine-specific)